MCTSFEHKTADQMPISDWSSDVCSSDLAETTAPAIAGLLPTNSRNRGSSDCGAYSGTKAAEPLRQTAIRRRSIGVPVRRRRHGTPRRVRSEEHTPELQSLLRISYAVFCLTHTKIVSLHNVVSVFERSDEPPFTS